MKNIKIIIVLLFSLNCLLGCSPDEEVTIPNIPSIFKAKVNGVQYTASFTAAAYSTEYNLWAISGYISDDNQITLNIPNLNIGTYTENIIYSIAGLYVENNTNYYSESGDYIVKITAYQNDKICGTFSFTGTEQDGGNTISITDGQFINVPIGEPAK